jgi:hypothetical protein
VLVATALVLTALSAYLILRDVDAGLGAGLMVVSLAVLVAAVLSASTDDDAAA